MPQGRDSETHAALTLTNTHDSSTTAVVGPATTRIRSRTTFLVADVENSVLQAVTA